MAGILQANVNYFAVVAAAAASMALGFLWYGPLFGNEWKRMMNFTPKIMKSIRMTPKKAMVLALVASLVMACVLAHIMKSLGAATIPEGIMTGFWIWLGFAATIMVNSVLFENKPWRLYLLNASYQLASILAMSIILIIWT